MRHIPNHFKTLCPLTQIKGHLTCEGTFSPTARSVKFRTMSSLQKSILKGKPNFCYQRVGFLSGHYYFSRILYSVSYLKKVFLCVRFGGLRCIENLSGGWLRLQTALEQ